MRQILSRCKQSLFKGIGAILFYSGGLKQLNRWVNGFQLLTRDGRAGFPFIRKRTTNNVQIFDYHRVGDEEDLFFAPFPIADFTRQMDYLAAGWNVLSLEEAVERMKRDDVPENAIVLTFDDGYRDNYLNAFPILKERSLPATVFLATDAIGSGKVLWHDRVFSAFRKTRVQSFESLGIPGRRYSFTQNAQKVAALHELLPFLWSVSDSERASWVDKLIERLEVEDLTEANGLMLSWDEVRTMEKNGISFGSHTVTHPVLSRVPIDRAEEEIRVSKKTIEAELGKPVKTFAYPCGKKTHFTEGVKRALQDAGYVCAVTTMFGVNDRRQDPFELRRGRPWDKDIATFGLRLNYFKFCS